MTYKSNGPLSEIPAATPFITAPSTPIVNPQTPVSTSSTTSLPTSSTTSSLTPSPLITSNRPVTRSHSRLHHIFLDAPSSFLAQGPTSNESVSDILCLLASANSSEPYEPLTYEDVIRDTSPYHLQWQMAMQEEFDSLIQNQTWGLSAVPSDRIPLGGKWVFRLKRRPKREITRFKARCE